MHKLSRTDAECQGAKCSVCTRVAVSADDYCARYCQAKLRSDDVNNACPGCPISKSRMPDAFVSARNSLMSVSPTASSPYAAAGTRYGMIGRCKSELWITNLETALGEFLQPGSSAGIVQ